MKRFTRKELKRIRTGLLFLFPNIFGFLAFTIIPLVLSFVLAFTNWDVRRHNMFKEESLEFIGLENFSRLFSHPQFYQYLGNTLFLMIGIPFSIAGSLILALLLTRDAGSGRSGLRVGLLAASVIIGGCSLLLMFILGAPNVFILLSLLVLTLLVSGVLGGPTIYRTVFYAPHFTAGVATFLLWKQMYHAETGPINNILRPVLDRLESLVLYFPSWSGGMVSLLLLACFFILLHGYLKRLHRARSDAEVGTMGLTLSLVLIMIPPALVMRWGPPAAGLAVFGTSLAMVLFSGFRMAGTRPLHEMSEDRGLGSCLMLSSGILVLQFLLLGLARVFLQLPAMAAEGLSPPNWLSDYHWAKPAIMFMAFWAAVGSNNMILYIAGLTNIPRELYEAADIDGASGMQRFWNITWPQLAPVTFFIVIMSMINGLQGGFEMARTMTEGGPAGATTTLSYFVFIEGFETGRLGYASAVVWTLFIMVFAITLFNFKFGNRYVND